MDGNKQNFAISHLLASDSSLDLLQQVRQRDFDAVAANIERLFYQSKSLDFHTSVAVLQNIWTPETELFEWRSSQKLTVSVRFKHRLRISGGKINLPFTGRKKVLKRMFFIPPSFPVEAYCLPKNPGLKPFFTSDVLLQWNVVKKNDMESNSYLTGKVALFFKSFSFFQQLEGLLKMK